MRDCKILVLNDGTGVDIDIIDGTPTWLDYPDQTQDQRAALSTYCCAGTMPGNLDFGVHWGLEFSDDFTVTTLNSEIQMQLQNCAKSDIGEGTSYQGILIPEGSQIGVLVTRSVA